ncbi:hypothetical protein ERX46_01225 [Brumimicrobium glaciale]|uniref:Uncharacterized protein n=1 Tax=Brumimicrobium glaciale TaxID=200475 RepID=A0A4V1WG67_9FLAO|nr:hypothetical protein [Brumimicrobium glaciale]RYM35641.1 hypothetical protein ERX46_01225 [Brumimicrobium glaciale]
MKHVILTLGIFGLAFLTSCDNTTEAEPQETVEQEHPAGEEHPSAEASHDHGEIALNNGEKWKVNEEMKPFVMKGQELVTTYLDSGDEDFKSLAENVAAQNKQLISSCTMDGTSHDELHKWLHPHLELTKELQNTETMDQANHNVKSLMESYNEYHKYFN